MIFRTFVVNIYAIFLRLAFIGIMAVTLSACPSESSTGPDPISEPELQRAVQVRITSPSSSAVIETPDRTVNLAGTASGQGAIQSVAWKNDRGGTGDAIGKENWLVEDIVLQLGNNTITVTAKDAAGKSDSQNIVINRENSAPSTGGTSNPNPIIMYSYHADLSNAAPIKDASLQQGLLYFYLVPSDDWQKVGIEYVDYFCCKGMRGPGAGTPHQPRVSVVDEPWSLVVDTSAFTQGGTRQIYFEVKLSNGKVVPASYTTFTVARSSSRTNNAPTIGGTPATSATPGLSYFFRPTSSDADGDTMHFSIANQPYWTVFDPSTGRLSGTPGDGDIGRYSNIIVQVSDGKQSASLPAFSITVTAFGSGATTLNWAAPTQRIDNTPLTNLAAFRLLFGQAPSVYGNEIFIDNPGLSKYVVENLTSGKWYFILTAIDADGWESSPSNEIGRNIE